TILLRSLPYYQPDRLVTVTETLPQMGTDEIGVAAGEYVDYRNRNRSFSSVAAFQSDGFNLTGQGQPLRVNAARVSASAFPLLGVSAELGRTFLEEEDRSGKVVLLSHALWEHKYGSDANIVGKTVKLDEQSYNVIGVMPTSFRFPFDGAPLSEMADVWVPIAFDPHLFSPENRTQEFGVGLVGRLRAGVTLAQAQQDVTGVAHAFMKQYGYSGTIQVVPKAYAFARHTTEKARPLIWLMSLAVVCIFLIACANVANLLLARASQRRDEMAVRTAIGAGRFRVLRQCLVESLLLALTGAAAGVGVAQALVFGLRHFGPADVPRLQEASLHPLALLFTLAVSFVSATAFGFAPAWRLSKTAPMDALREARQTGPGRGTQRLQHFVAVFEMAAAVVLLVSGGLLLKSFVRVLNAPTGFNPNGVFVVRTIFDPGSYPEAAKRAATQRQLLNRLAEIPGVTAVAAASHLPLSDVRQIGFRLEHAAADDFHWAQNSLVSPGYFRTMGISLMRGRDFSEQDLPDTGNVAVISETLAREYFPGRDAIGQRFEWGRRWLFTIAGIAADVRISSLDADPPPMIYFSMFQVQSGASSRTAFELRTANTAGLFDAVQTKIWAVDKDLPLYQSSSLADLVSESLAQRRFTALLLGGFALVALLLAAIGLFGVISYLVAERTREFGLRLALGANHADIYTQVLKRAGLLGAAGCAIGLAVSLLVSQTLQASLYGVSAFDLSTFVLAPLVLLAVALFAAYWPARRAAKVDPMVALRYE
ncbi:MAG TPA: ABC transporter permease, partial [Candidatus Sulfotelmatobacter sp.]|nr:ABC transporter permease [Candidatus Sulfotelmatobacter sp.]